MLVMCVPDFDVLNITKRRHALNRRRIVDIFTQLQLRVYLDQEQNKPETNSHNDSFVKKSHTDLSQYNTTSSIH